MRKLLTISILAFTVLAGCKENQEPKAITGTGTAAYLSSTNTGDEVSKSRDEVFIKYVDAWGEFQNVAREVELNKNLYDETGKSKFAERYNALLPRYHRLGRKRDSLHKLFKVVDTVKKK